MAIKILYDVPTSDLQANDVVIRNDGEAQVFVRIDPIAGYEPPSEYVNVTWAEQQGSRVTFQSTAQPWNTWPVVVREL